MRANARQQTLLTSSGFNSLRRKLVLTRRVGSSQITVCQDFLRFYFWRDWQVSPLFLDWQALSTLDFFRATAGTFRLHSLACSLQPDRMLEDTAECFGPLAMEFQAAAASGGLDLHDDDIQLVLNMATYVHLTLQSGSLQLSVARSFAAAVVQLIKSGVIRLIEQPRLAAALAQLVSYTHTDVKQRLQFRLDLIVDIMTKINDFLATHKKYPRLLMVRYYMPTFVHRQAYVCCCLQTRSSR